jgi:rRNA maturation endonuclease Nob1
VGISHSDDRFHFLKRRRDVRFERVCEECGEEFDAKTMFTRFCGAKCRMRAYRKTEEGKAAYREYNKRYKRG